MGKVYQSLKEVVKLQRSKNDPVALAGEDTRMHQVWTGK